MNVRYYPEFRKLTFWQSLKHFLRTTNWVRLELHYHPVREGEYGYEGAPFETTWNFVGTTEIIEKRNYKEHDL